jgi:hypothetical protein
LVDVLFVWKMLPSPLPRIPRLRRRSVCPTTVLSRHDRHVGLLCDTVWRSVCPASFFAGTSTSNIDIFPVANGFQPALKSYLLDLVSRRRDS